MIAETRENVSTQAPATAFARAREPVHGGCRLCGSDDANPVAVGEDFAHRSSTESFLALSCKNCGLIYLSPEPQPGSLAQIETGLGSPRAIEQAASWLGRRRATRRLRRWCRALPPRANLLAVGCDMRSGGSLEEIVQPGWRVEGIEPGEQLEASLAELGLPSDHFDLVLLNRGLERQQSSVTLLHTVRRLLRPGGRVVLVTPDTDSPSYKNFGGRHWAGYDFPRNHSFFGAHQLRRLASSARLRVESISPLMDSTIWVRSVHNMLIDWHAPEWAVERVTPRAWLVPAGLGLIEAMCWLGGKGALISIVLVKQDADTSGGA